ncbi:DUF4118 domain-containing protein [Stagnihabitans tardus]|uniref:histidine kinase n=1 Tax=Stagnihabitans tardus TaxID=2699202 RepID=A0AAE4Y893_9RHOB|nr:DUF4118 domain-containing protein [Stagnihabitans tardus]NBZ86453.1 DUF4118 domain-containing protein [Stagnihabitans tardus]
MDPQAAPGALSADLPGWPPAPRPAGLAAALGLVAVTAGLAQLELWALPATEATVPLILLTGVLVSAVAFGFWTGLFAALLAFGALNFLFTEPLFTFHIDRVQDLVALWVFLLVAGLSGWLAGRLHDRAEAARTRAEALVVLGELSHDLMGAETATEVLTAAERHLARLSGAAMIVTPQSLASLPASALAGAERCLRTGQPQPAAAPGWPGSDLGFLSLAPDLALGHGAPSGREAPHRARAIAALADQTRTALQRLDFAENARAERLRAEAFATRSAVLSSVGHDLRTPLATILGAASALRDLDATLTAAARTDLLTAIEEEAGRLNRHLANLLQLSRLDLGAPPRSDWVDPGDIALAAATRARRAFPGARIEITLPPLPMIRSDGGLLEQALFNLIDNGLAHGAAPVRIGGKCDRGSLWLKVSDAGEGVPPLLRAWLDGPDLHPAPGQGGLGLAVAKGIARHLGGRLTAPDGMPLLHLPETP